MGYLINGSLEGDGKHRQSEWDTVHCAHCQHLIKVVSKVLAGGNVKHYDTPYRCERCAAPICKFCGTQRAGQCSPVAAQIEQGLKLQRGLEQFDFHYRSVTRS